MSAYLKQYRLAAMQKQGDFERLVPFGKLMTRDAAEHTAQNLRDMGHVVFVVNTKSE